MPTLSDADKNQLSIHFFLIVRVLSIYRRKMDGVHPSQMKINALNPAPTSHFTNIATFFDWKMGKDTIKFKKYLIILATIMEKNGIKESSVFKRNA